MIRYMGTKRFLARPVSQLIAALPGQGRVLDLFCGTGAVTAALHGTSSVIMNDASAFLGPLLRTRFLTSSRTSPRHILELIRSEYLDSTSQLSKQFANRLNVESRALASGHTALSEYMESTPHVGICSNFQDMAGVARLSGGKDRYCLVTLYFSAGYVSTKQAIQLDALRCAIDRQLTCDQMKDQGLAALTVTLDRVLNSPGHSAQYLRPNTVTAYRRIYARWNKDIWPTFVTALSDLIPHGDPHWRIRNAHHKADALDLLAEESIGNIRAIYADPPYTKDQYSRYYHVHETLHHYDFPESTGRGRYRDNRFSSAFSASSRVVPSFRRLFEETANKNIPLVLSYPADGLLAQQGVDTVGLAKMYFSDISTSQHETTHSTLGASSGTHSHKKVEHIYVCRP